MSFIGVIIGIGIAIVVTLGLAFGGFGLRFTDLWIAPLIAAFCGLFMIWGKLHEISNIPALQVQLQREQLEKWQKGEDDTKTPAPEC
jgi:hypothetical protein